MCDDDVCAVDGWGYRVDVSVQIEEGKQKHGYMDRGGGARGVPTTTRECSNDLVDCSSRDDEACCMEGEHLASRLDHFQLQQHVYLLCMFSCDNRNKVLRGKDIVSLPDANTVFAFMIVESSSLAAPAIDLKFGWFSCCSCLFDGLSNGLRGRTVRT